VHESVVSIDLNGLHAAISESCFIGLLTQPCVDLVVRDNDDGVSFAVVANFHGFLVVRSTARDPVELVLVEMAGVVALIFRVVGHGRSLAVPLG
jgi:hypothetical protein